LGHYRSTPLWYGLRDSQIAFSAWNTSTILRNSSADESASAIGLRKHSQIPKPSAQITTIPTPITGIISTSTYTIHPYPAGRQASPVLTASANSAGTFQLPLPSSFLNRACIALVLIGRLPSRTRKTAPSGCPDTYEEIALCATEQMGSLRVLLPLPRTSNEPIPLPFGAVTSPICSAVTSAIRVPYDRHQNSATSRGNLAVFSSSRVSSSFRNTGASLLTDLGSFSDTARFYSIRRPFRFCGR